MKKLISLILITMTIAAAMCGTTFGAGSALSLGDYGDDVYTLQQLLAAYGYFYEEPTGYYGEVTEQAVAAFQYDAGFLPDGIADPVTAACLGLDLSGLSYGSSNSGYFDYTSAVLDAAAYTPAAPAGLCAAWVTQVMKNAGILTYDINELRPTYYSYASTSGLDWGYDTGFNANDFWAYVCYSSDLRDLQPGMIVATRSSYSYMGRQYGHIGIYLGGGLVVSSIGYLETLSLEEWIQKYNNTAAGSSIRWGFLPM